MTDKPTPVPYVDATADVELVIAPSPSDALIDAWFVETFYGVPLATEYFNRFRAATEELKKRLAAVKR